MSQSTQGNCDLTVSCSLGTVAANSTVTITITATVIARDTTLTERRERVELDARSESVEQHRLGERHGAGHRRSRRSTRPGTANPTQGGADTFTLTVANDGPDTAHGVVVNDSLPSQFTATTASGGGFTCTLPGGRRGDGRLHARHPGPDRRLAAADHDHRHAGGGLGGSVVGDAATVSSNTGDPDLSNNTDTVNQPIGPVADVARSPRPRS